MEMIRSTQSNAKVEGNRIQGYCAVFDKPATVVERGRTFVEIIKRGSFAKSVKSDIRLLWNHDTSKILARTVSGTLTLREDDFGVAFEASINPHYPEVIEGIQRGDIDGCSFGARSFEDDWVDGVRHVRSADVLEISLCSFPIYKETSVEITRSLELFKRKLKLANLHTSKPPDIRSKS